MGRGFAIVMLLCAGRAQAQCVDDGPRIGPVFDDLRRAVAIGGLPEYDGARITASRQGTCETAGPVDTESAPNTIYYLNGVATSPERFCDTLRAIRTITGRPVVGIFNTSAGLGTDLREANRDLLTLERKSRSMLPGLATRFGSNPSLAGRALAAIVHSRRLRGLPVEVWAHSQGAIIASTALYEAGRSLRLHEIDIDDQIRVVTFGAAAGQFPEGAHQEHWIHRRDPVAMAYGPRLSTRIRYFGWFGLPSVAKHDVDMYLREWHRRKGAPLSAQ